MNGQLHRVQVYLDPNDVTLLDQLAGHVKITRSQIIRDATHSVASAYARVARVLATPPASPNPLADLIGIEQSKTGRIGLNIDDIYLHD